MCGSWELSVLLDVYSGRWEPHSPIIKREGAGTGAPRAPVGAANGRNNKKLFVVLPKWRRKWDGANAALGDGRCCLSLAGIVPNGSESTASRCFITILMWRCRCWTGVDTVRCLTTPGYSPTGLFGSTSFRSVAPSSGEREMCSQTGCI